MSLNRPDMMWPLQVRLMRLKLQAGRGRCERKRGMCQGGDTKANTTGVGGELE